MHIQGAGVFLGYWDDPEATARAFAPGHWYRTGDFGRIEDGVLFLESRMRDLILEHDRVQVLLSAWLDAWS